MVIAKFRPLGGSSWRHLAEPLHHWSSVKTSARLWLMIIRLFRGFRMGQFNSWVGEGRLQHSNYNLFFCFYRGVRRWKSDGRALKLRSAIFSNLRRKLEGLVFLYINSVRCSCLIFHSKITCYKRCKWSLLQGGLRERKWDPSYVAGSESETIGSNVCSRYPLTREIGLQRTIQFNSADTIWNFYNCDFQQWHSLSSPLTRNTGIPVRLWTLLDW